MGAGKELQLRSGGFPCRLAGCDRAFQVSDQTSMESLRAASSERTAHEIADHGYHHVKMEDERPYLPHQRIKIPKNDLSR